MPFKAKNARPPSSPLWDLSDWASKHLPTVAGCDEFVVAPLKDIGIEVRLSGGVTNPHAFSAACRTAAVALVVKHAGRGKQYMKCLDHYGSARTLSIDPRVSGPFGPWEKVGGVKVKRAIDWVACPDTAVQGDAARGRNVRVPFSEGEKYDLVVSIDVYHMDVATVLDLIGRSESGQVYLILRKFLGAGGADDVVVGRNGKAHVEQIFFRTSDGLIVSSPDKDSGFYAPHPSPDWLNQRHYEGVDIAPVAKLGPYHIIRCAKGLAGAIPIHLLPSTLGECEWVDLDSCDVNLWRFMSVYTRQKVLTHVPTLNLIGPKVNRKVPNGNILDTTQTHVQKAFASVEWLVALQTRDPERFRDLVDGTVLACLYHNRHEDTRNVTMLRQAHALSEGWLVRSRAVDNKFTRPWTGLGVACAIGASACLVAGGLYFPSLVGKMFAKPIATVEPTLLWTSEMLSSFIGAGWRTFADWWGRARRIPGAWAWRQRPVVSAVLEEALAWVSEPAAVVAYLFEFGRAEETSSAVGPLLMHLCCSGLRISGGVYGRCAALAGHVLWNGLGSTMSARFQEFLEFYKDGRVLSDVRSMWCAIPVGCTLPSYVSRMAAAPKEMRGTIEVRVDGLDVTVDEALDLLPTDVVGKNVMYPIAITHRVLHMPANVERNLLVAVLTRTHKDPFLGNPCPESARYANWTRLGDVVAGLCPDLTDRNITVLDNIKAMGKKGIRLQNAYEDSMKGVGVNLGKTINLKHNETISAQKEIDGILTMKPRAIQNLPALTHALMGGEARTFAADLHEIFDGRVHDVGGVPVRIFFASGYDQKHLNVIADAIEEGGVVFAMSGDDSIIGWGGLRQEICGEGDQTAFDQSQDDGPMKFFMEPILRKMGRSEEFILMAYAACAEGYTIRKGRMTVKGYGGVQMPTGVTTTTTFNSLSTLGSFVYFVMNRSRYATMAESGKDLGFTVKYFAHDSLATATFLKGWWQKDVEGKNQWMPLPSAVVKLGKVLNDPVKITKVVRRGKKCYLSPEVAVRVCATALASSYGSVDPSYPVFGAFLEMLKRLGTRMNKPLASLQESWKPQLTGIPVNRESVLEAMEIRYGVTPEEVASVEELLRRVKSLPAYIEHPVFDRLCVADY